MMSRLFTIRHYRWYPKRVFSVDESVPDGESIVQHPAENSNNRRKTSLAPGNSLAHNPFSSASNSSTHLALTLHKRPFKYSIFPFDTGCLSELAVAGTALLSGQHNQLLSSTIIMLGPRDPKSTSKVPYKETTRRLAQEAWNVDVVVEASLEQLHSLSTWYMNRSSNGTVNVKGTAQQSSQGEKRGPGFTMIMDQEECQTATSIETEEGRKNDAIVWDEFSGGYLQPAVPEATIRTMPTVGVVSSYYLNSHQSRKNKQQRRRGATVITEILNQSSLTPGLYNVSGNSQTRIHLTSTAATAGSGNNATGAYSSYTPRPTLSTLASYLSPIKRAWPWLITCLQQEVNQMNVLNVKIVVFMSGLAELLDSIAGNEESEALVRGFIDQLTESNTYTESATSNNTAAMQLMFVDGMCSGLLTNVISGGSLLVKPKSSFEQLLATLRRRQLNTTNAGAGVQGKPLHAKHQQPPSINLSDLMSAASIAYNNAVSGAVEDDSSSPSTLAPQCMFVADDRIIRAPLFIPSTLGSTNMDRATRNHIRQDASILVKMLLEDEQKSRARSNLALLLRELQKTYPEKLSLTAEGETRLSNMETLVTSMLDRICKEAPGFPMLALTASEVKRIVIHALTSNSNSSLIDADILLTTLAILYPHEPKVLSNAHASSATDDTDNSRSSSPNSSTSAHALPSSVSILINNLKLDKWEQRQVSNLITPDMLDNFTYSDVGALDAVKAVLHQVITLPLLRPELFMKGIAKDAVSGVLLFGPPGTGKTLLAKAVASQSGSNFLYVAASSIFEMWGIFSLARKVAPCIVFVDEVDSLLETRNSFSARTSRLEIVNEFMAEWDGLKSSINREQGIIVMAATNRPFVLDDAVLRRMPRRVLVDLPDELGRVQILRLHLKENVFEETDLLKVASLAENYSGSDLMNLAKTASLTAITETVEQEKKQGIEGEEVQGSLCQSANYLPRKASSNSTEARVVPIKWHHWEHALNVVPSSVRSDMESIKQLRKWNDIYGDKTIQHQENDGSLFNVSRDGRKRGTNKGIGFLTQDLPLKEGPERDESTTITITRKHKGVKETKMR